MKRNAVPRANIKVPKTKKANAPAPPKNKRTKTAIDALDSDDSGDEAFTKEKYDSDAEEALNSSDDDAKIPGEYILDDEERSTDGSDNGSDLDSFIVGDDEIEYASDYNSSLECTGFSSSEDELECRRQLPPSSKSKKLVKTKNKTQAVKETDSKASKPRMATKSKTAQSKTNAPK